MLPVTSLKKLVDRNLLVKKKSCPPQNISPRSDIRNKISLIKI